MKKILYIILFVPLTIFAQVQNPCYSINNFITQQNIINPPISYQLSGGWNMVGYTGTAENSGIVNQINSALSNDSSIESTFQIIKNVSGQFWSSNFAQLLSFTQGEGYMMYVISETATSLSFNSPINIPEITGCTDCEATNFNQWANSNDDSCNYDSDGDGVLDTEEIIGCEDETACNYNNTATDSDACIYPIDLDACASCSGEQNGSGTIVDNDSDDDSICNENEVIGCEEETACNYNNAATDSDACIYAIDLDACASCSGDQNGSGTIVDNDSDDDSICNENEVIGCEDETACNYNNAATDEGECAYAQDGYDCDGNITAQIGDQIEGGYLFYLDETGQRGLVAAMVDLTEGASSVVSGSSCQGIQFGYEWGCYQQSVSGAEESAIGTGYQNTMDIVNQGCISYYGGINAAEAALGFVSEGFSDWFLPSRLELYEVYNTIGNGSTLGNIGGFETECQSTSYRSSTEWGPNAFIVNFGASGYQSPTYVGTQHYALLRVRPIRAFGNWTEGCIDYLACNYNSEANMADGTCTYSEQGYDCDGNITAQIGDQIEGGYLFYLDETGQHGMVAALEDITEGFNIGINNGGGGEGFQWGCYNITISGADGEAIGTGYQNTLDIVAHNCETQNGGITAVQSTLNYSFEGFTDWYLPSKEELQEMYNTIGNGGLQGNIGGFDLSRYWSSTEISNTSAVTVGFNDGNAYDTNGYFLRRVRAVRAF